MTMFEIARKTGEVSEFWGDRMPMMVMEEAAELIQAISKYERDKSDDTRKNLVDEIGDMWISLMALQYHYDEDGTMADDIDKRIETKLNKKY